MLFGNRNSRAAKLTPANVQKMRELYASGEYTQGQLGQMFQLSVVHVGRILRGESWRQVGQPTSRAASLTAGAERLLNVQREVEELHAQGLDGFGRPLPPDPLDGGEGGVGEPTGVVEQLASEAARKSPTALERELGILPEVAEKAKKLTGRS